MVAKLSARRRSALQRGTRGCERSVTCGIQMSQSLARALGPTMSLVASPGPA